MKRFLTDSLIFLLIIFVFMGVTNANPASQDNNVSSFDQNIENNEEVNDGYVNVEIEEDYSGNSFSKVTNYVADKVIDVVNGGVGVLKKILKSFLD